MIKRLFVTLLAVLYLGVSSGATLHYQYCMGRLIKVSLWNGHNEKCHTCGMTLKEKAAKKCCTDKYQQLKSGESGAVTYAQITLGTSAVIPPLLPAYVCIGHYLPSHTVDYPVNKAPPPVTAIPLFLRNCNFRI